VLSASSSEDASPWYFKSCGSSPIEANGKMRVASPIVVRPSMTTCDLRLTPALSTTSSPTTQ
jgi:hypothetical protein